MKLRSRLGHKQQAVIFVLIALAVYSFILSATDRSLFTPSTYNSYALQTSRWLQGHLDLGQNYNYLELALFEDKVFLSFPPIPSVLLIPFCLIFGEAPPDTLVSVAVGLLGGIYALKLVWLAGREGVSALCWALFVTVGSNFLHVGYSADVWYFAQTCSFAFTMAALYYAMNDSLKSGWLSLFLLALAFGCRPLQIVFLPLVALLLWQKLRRHGFRFTRMLRKYWWWLIPAFCVGCFLMWLNFARFGNPFQFGHDYLPEFSDQRPNGQFSLYYLKENLQKLWRLPIADGKLDFPAYEGSAFWIFSPIFLVFVVYFFRNLRTVLRNPALPLTVLLIGAHLVALCCHATMGGWQFGNRYTVDSLPALFAALTLLLCEDSSDMRWMTLPLLVWGVLLNAVGTVALWHHWIT